MEYRNLGRTGVRVSPLCVGTMTFGGKTDQDEANAIIAHAVASGINFIDTANVYTHGQSEVITGNAIHETGLREHLVLATKCHGNMFKDNTPGISKKAAQLNPNRWGNSRRQIIAECERSLIRLQTDYIDLYQIHRPHLDCPIDETLRAMDDLVRSGKVRYIGCSTFAAWQVVTSLWQSEKLCLNRFVTEQPPYNILDRRIERELLPACEEYGLGVMPWSPLGGGFLTGKYKRGDTSTAGGRFSDGKHPRSQGLVNNEHAFDVVEGIEQRAKLKGCTTGQFALAWCVHQPGVTSPIVGPRTLDQFKDNLGALEVSIDEDDRQLVDELVSPGAYVAPFYEASFGPWSVR